MLEKQRDLMVIMVNDNIHGYQPIWILAWRKVGKIQINILIFKPIAMMAQE